MGAPSIETSRASARTGRGLSVGRQSVFPSSNRELITPSQCTRHSPTLSITPLWFSPTASRRPSTRPLSLRPGPTAWPWGWSLAPPWPCQQVRSFPGPSRSTAVGSSLGWDEPKQRTPAEINSFAPYADITREVAEELFHLLCPRGTCFCTLFHKQSNSQACPSPPTVAFLPSSSLLRRFCSCCTQ